MSFNGILEKSLVYNKRREREKWDKHCIQKTIQIYNTLKYSYRL